MNVDFTRKTPARSDERGHKTNKRVLVITAVAAERDAVLRGLGDASNVDVLAVGVGPIAAALSTYKALSKARFGLVVMAGIGGGFAGKAEVGSLVVANEIVGADLGAETPDGFQSLDELNLGTTRIQVDADLAVGVTKALRAAGLSVTTGPVLTLSTVTGSAATALDLAARVPGAAAEAMEGFGVAAAAREYGIPVIEIRAISNLIGPRDRAAWRIGEALDALEKASSVLLEVF